MTVWNYRKQSTTSAIHFFGFCFISSGAAYPPTDDRPVTEGEMFDGDPHDVDVPAGTQAEFAELLKGEHLRWERTVKAANITPN
mgnify:CR=1 FL=1